MKKSDLPAFLAELAALYSRYGVHITSCGCCNSPWLLKATAKEIEDSVEHLRDNAKDAFERSPRAP